MIEMFPLLNPSTIEAVALFGRIDFWMPEHLKPNLRNFVLVNVNAACLPNDALASRSGACCVVGDMAMAINSFLRRDAQPDSFLSVFCL